MRDGSWQNMVTFTKLTGLFKWSWPFLFVSNEACQSNLGLTYGVISYIELLPCIYLECKYRDFSAFLFFISPTSFKKIIGILARTLMQEP